MAVYAALGVAQGVFSLIISFTFRFVSHYTISLVTSF